MLTSQSGRPRAFPYSYDGTDCRQNLVHRHSLDSSTYENEYGVHANRLRIAQKTTMSVRLRHFDETIAMLDSSMKEVQEHVKPLLDQFKEEVQGIRHYANQTLIDSLWEMRLDMKQRWTRRNFRKEESSEEYVRVREMMQLSKRAKQAWVNVETAMKVAAYGTRATVSQGSRKLLLAENKDGIERAVLKLEASGKQCLELLEKSKKRHSQVEALMKEMEFLDRVIDEWRAFVDGRGEMKDNDQDTMYDDY